jgi:hypothetical protein
LLVKYEEQQQTANAHLISAAPKMYKALKSIQRIWFWSGASVPPEELLDEVSAAFDQAEGKKENLRGE